MRQMRLNAIKYLEEVCQHLGREISKSVDPYTLNHLKYKLSEAKFRLNLIKSRELKIKSRELIAKSNVILVDFKKKQRIAA